MNRRNFLKVGGLWCLALSGCILYPDEGWWNPCLSPEDMPDDLSGHEIVKAAWEGIDPKQLWDVHVHLAGTGDSGKGIWLNPDMKSIFYPIQNIQRRFFINGGCAEEGGNVDSGYLHRLLDLCESFPEAAKFMALAFDHTYDEKGVKVLEESAFYVPNTYARDFARKHPKRIEWVASVHPYRKDVKEVLNLVALEGAKAIKWLPPAMGIDPASPLCVPFYRTLADLNLPLLTHGGKEGAVHGADMEEYANPLRLRHALDLGVRVIVAHCASQGKCIDLDQGKNGPKVENFELFERLMDEKANEALLFGDISAITQSNRVDVALEKIMVKEEWHNRLLNGSDYPLPGVMPLFSMKLFVDRGFLSKAETKVLSDIRKYNPLLFDFLLKRTLRFDKKRLSAGIFQTRDFFT